MLSHSSKTLSFTPSPSPSNPKILNPKSRILCINQTVHYITSDSKCQVERGIQFEVGNSFFRHESFTGRDLGVLAAALYKRSKSQLRVLDAMCGCGIRSLRYLAEAKADFVLANDANDEYRRIILSNLSQISRFSEDERRWVVTHSDADRVMTECYLKRDFFDFIDVDSFGSESRFLRSAFNACKMDGLVYVTSTDGFPSGGHRPVNSLASYGAYIRPMPYSNEVGLRMVIGGAIREASVMGYTVTPLFSYYSYHGPVFRVMLRINRGKFTDIRNYGFISYCFKCGDSQAHSWDKLGKIGCPCSDKHSASLVVSGPLWTGHLHDAAYLQEMLSLAEEWGWIGNGSGLALEKLLKLMIDESDPGLGFGYIKLDEVSRRGKMNTPPLRTMISALQKVLTKLPASYSRGNHSNCLGFPAAHQGYFASRSHIAPNALKTNCPMTACISIAKELKVC